MHPDAIIAALKAELAEVRDDEHKKAIEAEIKRVDALPRPAEKADEPGTVFDFGRSILEALKVELAEAVSDDHKAAVRAEIKKLESKLSAKEADVDEPSADEIEQRKQARTGRKVERATAAPGEARGDKAEEAVTAPEGAEE
jgi:hypothetical protein